MPQEFDDARFDALLESVRLLQASLEAGEILGHLLRSVMAQLLAKRGFVAVENHGAMTIVHARGLPGIIAGDSYSQAKLEAEGIERIFPIGDHDQSLGLLGVGRFASGKHADGDAFVDALVGVAAGAVNNARAHGEVRRLNLDLDRKVQELRTLLDLVRGFTSATDPEDVARMLGLTIAGQWALSRYGIAAWKDGHPPVVRQKGMVLPELPFLRGIAESIDGATATADLRPDDAAPLLAQKIGAVVPIRIAGNTIGVLLPGVRPGSLPYGPDDLEYTSGLADQAAVALENAWHFRETLEKKKIEKELELAAEIQRRLLPSKMPVPAGFDVSARTRPARHVGGDYFDAIPLGASSHVYCVADVSGKGIAASLLMSNFQASLRALLEVEKPLPLMVARMNDLMYASTPMNKYVTSIMAAVDHETGQCRVVNAGHNDGFVLRRDGAVERLKAGGLSVGLLPTRPYREDLIELGPGDLLALYSDGVTEANDVDENEFGDDRLIECLRVHASESSETIVEAVYSAVDAFAGTAPQYDDITLMVVRCTSLPA